MLSGKFLCTLIGLLLAVFAICNLNLNQNTIEGWWGGTSFTWKAVPAIQQKGKCGNSMMAAGGNFVGHLSDDRFIKTPGFQSLMSPRFSNANYGSFIKYNMPDYENQAVPCSPLTFGDMAQENYTTNNRENYSQNVVENYPTSCGSGSCGGGCSPVCGKGGLPVPYQGGSTATEPGYAAGNYNQVLDKVYSGSNYPDATDSLPVGTMTTIDAEGNVTEPVVYTRYMFANRKSYLRSQGDPIRGDLAIVPCEGNWFSVHPNVNLDLQEGAMNVMGGIANEQGRSLSQLIFDASGQADTTIAGVNLADTNITPQYNGQHSAIGDVQISATP